ncbi:phosphotransferase family protein [Lentibacillus sp. N15]|uniref:phosphotransferase family protein n=1 Tax=Lentibacillus songyuanensis TaxID=3136161 RepID=UPI0031BB502F
MKQAFNDTISVRNGEELDHKSLEEFVRASIPEVPDKPMEMEQFSAGHSNLTYLLRFGSWEAVLRRPPLGPVAPKAHDMKREYTILNNLHPRYKTAPKPYVYSDNEQIIGSPFFIMERRKGVVVDTSFPANITYSPELGQRISNVMVDQLVALHQVDYQKTDLINLSRPDGFIERQVGGWIKRYERSKMEEIPGVETLTKWIRENIPKSPAPTVIHYDYKLNNAMFSNDFRDMAGLFDWEMTTIGDPLADLGVALAYWMQNDDPEQLKTGLGKPPVTIRDGFFSRSEFLEAYTIRSGRDVSTIHFYLTFAYFKLAVILQQIYYRYVKGQTNDTRFAHFNHSVASLMQHALQSTKGV